MQQGGLSKKLTFGLFMLLAAIASILIALRATDSVQLVPDLDSQVGTISGRIPVVEAETVVEGLSHPWDVAFLPTGELLYVQRSGVLSVYADGQPTDIGVLGGVVAVGEGGLMGLTIDPAFSDDRYIYACYNTADDVRVSRWVLNDDFSGVSDRFDVVTGITANPSGRHSGCRLAFDNQQQLWITTGDAAIGSTPQDPTDLAGKILRVDSSGKPIEGNLPAPFDARIFSYGHRNVQGIALLDEPRGGVYGLSVEHGPGVDDEVNLLIGGNFGWNPMPGYNESVPMTDTGAYPNAIEAVWSSGRPTLAPSGASFINGVEWGAWNGALAVAMLRSEHIRILQFGDEFDVTGEQAILDGDYGRFRSITQGPDGSLYVTTDNGDGQDSILKLSPR
jgi:aldose sugar dehydrogenase